MVNRVEMLFLASTAVFLPTELSPCFADLLILLHTAIPISDSAVFLPIFLYFYLSDFTLAYIVFSTVYHILFCSVQITTPAY